MRYFNFIIIWFIKVVFSPWVGKIPGERNGNPLQYSCLGNSMNRGAWASYSSWGHARVRHN